MATVEHSLIFRSRAQPSAVLVIIGGARNRSVRFFDYEHEHHFIEHEHEMKEIVLAIRE